MHTDETSAADGRLNLALAAGRAKASLLAPYLGTALFALIPVASTQIPRTAVDRWWRFYFNPEVMIGSTAEENAWRWLHEVGHVLDCHHDRWVALGAPATQAVTFNRAGDAVINHRLREAGTAEPFDGGITRTYPERVPGGTPNMTAEQFFRLLAAAEPDPIAMPGPGDPGDPGSEGEPEEARQGEEGDDAERTEGAPSVAGPRQDQSDPDDGQGAGQEQGETAGHAHEVDCGSGAGGPGRPWELGEDPSDGSVTTGRAQRIREAVARDIVEHAERVRGRGTVPGGWARWAQEVLDPTIDWRDVLRTIKRRGIAHVMGRHDYSYTRPSRRSGVNHGVVMPSMRAPRPPRIAEVIDTSMSVDDNLLAQTLAETRALLKQVRGTIDIIACDAHAAEVQTVRDLRHLNLTGGGGTDMRVGLAAAAALRPRVDMIIVTTDGDTPWPQAPLADNPSAKVVVVLVDGPRSSVPSWMHTVVVTETGP